MGEIFWTSAFLDLPARTHAAAVEFWAAVTGYAVSEPRGEHLEFATLVPPSGDDHLRLQRVGDEEPRVHLDLHVADPHAAADRAVSLGATVLAEPGHVVLRSPGGLVHCFVTHAAGRPAPPATWADGGRSVVDQVCLDVPAGTHDAEVAFWTSLTGWPWHPSDGFPELGRLLPDNGQRLSVLVQRLDEREGPARAHLDLAATDRRREVRRHARLGALVEREGGRPGAGWTVMRDPAGAAYCVTDRAPR